MNRALALIPSNFNALAARYLLDASLCLSERCLVQLPAQVFDQGRIEAFGRTQPVHILRCHTYYFLLIND